MDVLDRINRVRSHSASSRYGGGDEARPSYSSSGFVTTQAFDGARNTVVAMSNPADADIVPRAIAQSPDATKTPGERPDAWRTQPRKQYHRRSIFQYVSDQPVCDQEVARFLDESKSHKDFEARIAAARRAKALYLAGYTSSSQVTVIRTAEALAPANAIVGGSRIPNQYTKANAYDIVTGNQEGLYSNPLQSAANETAHMLPAPKPEDLPSMPVGNGGDSIAHSTQFGAAASNVGAVGTRMLLQVHSEADVSAGNKANIVVKQGLLEERANEIFGRVKGDYSFATNIASSKRTILPATPGVVPDGSTDVAV